jgi:hypothetical protein
MISGRFRKAVIRSIQLLKGVALLVGRRFTVFFSVWCFVDKIT